MHVAFPALAFAALAVASPMPGGVTSAIAPQQSPPPGCSPNYDGTFVISPTNLTAGKRDLDERNTQLGITLQNGILTDPQGRTGYIASNEQFQFDDPPQAGAIWTAGFTVCQNGSLALGNTAVWYRCLSGNFYNLYYESIGGQCIPSLLHTSPLSGSGPGPVPASLSTETFASTTTTANAASSGSSSSGTTGSTSASTSAASAATSGSTTAIGAGGKTTGATAGATTGATTGKTTGKPNASAATTSGSGSATSGSGSATSSSTSTTTNAAETLALGREMFGLAAGLLAFAVL